MFNRVNSSNATAYVNPNLIFIGIQQDIDIVLDMIKQKLPDKRFHVSFRDISAELCKSDYSLLADNYNVSVWLILFD